MATSHMLEHVGSACMSSCWLPSNAEQSSTWSMLQLNGTADLPWLSGYACATQGVKSWLHIWYVIHAILASRIIHKNIKSMTFECLHIDSLCEYVGIVVVSRDVMQGKYLCCHCLMDHVKRQCSVLLLQFSTVWGAAEDDAQIITKYLGTLNDGNPKWVEHVLYGNALFDGRA